ncbi:hypothetical protein KAR48_18105 [bacterium]|nr:hypothetical protein [bacterium]
MKTFEYIAEILPDGHLSIPKAVIKRFKLAPHSKLRISILPFENKKKSLSRFTGKWQDDRETSTTVKEIYKLREENRRSERMKL